MSDELVIFDCDGVLVDSELISSRCTAEVLEELKLDVDVATILEQYAGLSDETMAARIERRWDCVLPAHFRSEIQKRTLQAFVTELRPIDDVAWALDVIATRRCVASSGAPRRIERALEVTGLLSRLTPHLFSAAMVENGKPAPDLFLLAAERMQTPPARCTVIEDSVAGVTAGKAAGMRVLGFTGGSHVESHHHAPKLMEAGADTIFDSMRALPELLGKL